MKALRVLALSAMAIGGSSAAAMAAPVATDTWYEFGFGGVGSSLFSCPVCVDITNPTAIDAPDGPWTFTLLTSAVLIVADVFQSGDVFEMFNFGTSLGQTSAATQGSNCGADLTCALGNLNFSRGYFNLGPGSYSITGSMTASPFGGGAAAFRIETSPVPVPAGVGMLGAALAGLAGLAALRRRKSA